MTDKIAVFGGTFNPIHNGHIMIARWAMKECGLKKVVFMPNGNPPHKTDFEMAPAQHRYNMTKLAIEGVEGFCIDDYEIKKKTPSYTADTQVVMKEIYGGDIYFIIGADSLYTIDTWKSPDILRKECSFIVADRSCDEGDNLKEACRQYNNSGGRVKRLEMPRYDVTSTDIRESIRAGIDVSEYLPGKVLEYIKINKLYGSPTEAYNDN